MLCSPMNATDPDPDRTSRKATTTAMNRAVANARLRLYWDHLLSQAVPDHLLQLAAKVEEALAKRVAAPSIAPGTPVESGDSLDGRTQVTDIDGK